MREKSLLCDPGSELLTTRREREKEEGEDMKWDDEERSNTAVR